MLAFTTAVRVRTVSPYSLEMVFDGLPGFFGGELSGLQEGMVGPQDLARAQGDVLDGGLLPGQHGPHRASAHAHDPHRGHVALQEGVGRLGRAVGEEDDIFGVDGKILQRTLKYMNDALGDPFVLRVGG